MSTGTPTSSKQLAEADESGECVVEITEQQQGTNNSPPSGHRGEQPNKKV
jgi:hypothetical protein